MSGTDFGEIKDFHDVIRLLESHPEWRADLRRLILTDEIVNLPGQVSRLVEQVTALTDAQRRTDAQVAALTVKVEILTTQVETLTTRVEMLTMQVETLTTQMTKLTAQMVELTRTVQRNSDDIGKLKGMGLESRIRTHGGAFFGRVLRRPHVLSADELTDLLEDAIDQGKLSAQEMLEIQWADAVVRGARRTDGAAVHLVVEASWTVDTDDVERAVYRAALLAKAGVTVQAVVAGPTIRPQAAQLAFGLQVVQVIDKETVPSSA